ncbi:MAG TPA: hypothetical protein VGR29_05905 [Thermomicrobiales bacterium]|nr:hypothetical protein [Thermomicrobiales bacterium]
MYLADSAPLTDDIGELSQLDPRLHGKAKIPMPLMSSGPNPVPDQDIPKNVNKNAVTGDGKM